MGGWLRRFLVFLVLLAGLGIPLGYWLRGRNARAESRRPWTAAVVDFQVPPPLRVEIPPPEREKSEPSRQESGPPPGASLEVVLPRDLSRSFPPGRLLLRLRGPNGASRLLPLGLLEKARWEDLPPGLWRLTLLVGPPGPEALPLWEGKTLLKPEEAKRLEIPSPPLAALEGKVILAGPEGSAPAPPGLPVILFAPGGVRKTKTGEGGRFSFQGLLPGPALLVVERGSGSSLGPSAQEIRLQAGTPTQVTLTLRR